VPPPLLLLFLLLWLAKELLQHHHANLLPLLLSHLPLCFHVVPNILLS
jgi:hypothetical protein